MIRSKITMKKILSIIAAVIALSACIKENILPAMQNEGDDLVLNFGIVVPEAQTATKSFSSPAINSLTVIAFDEFGYYVTAAEARPVDGWEISSTKETEFTVSLPQSASARKLHFVANCPKAVRDFTYGPEVDIMTALTTEGDADAYWQCVEVSNLLQQNLTAINDSLEKIPMIRNFAKVKIGTIKGGFTLTGYALVNVPTKGAVVPYNEKSKDFQKYENNGTGKNYSALIQDNYHGFIPADTDFKFNDKDELAGLDWVEEEELNNTNSGVYTYESLVSNQTALLVRGTYNSKVTYYKVALYDTKNYDILRNIQYTVNLEVLGEGYSDPMDAVRAEAGNNVSASTSTENLLNISDGSKRLFVEYTAKQIVSTEPFTLKYKFLPSKNATAINKLAGGDGKGTPNVNEPITITSVIKSEDDTSKVVLNYDVVDANKDGNPDQDREGFSTLVITPTSSLPESDTEVWSEDFIITSTYGGVVLSRTVKLNMLKPYILNVECTPKKVAKSIGAEVNLNIEVKKGLPDAIFPIIFDVEAAALSIYPNPNGKDILGNQITMPVVSGTSIIPAKKTGSNTFHFQRKVTKEEYDALVDASESTATTVKIPCYFLTNKAESASDVYVYNEYFTLDFDSFVNFEAKYFTNLAFPNGVKATVDSPTTFNFTIASNAPQSMTVTLNGLVLASTETKLTKVAGTENKYTYSNPGTGNKTLSLLTVKPEGKVSVELEADEYDYARASLSAEQANTITINSATLNFTWNYDYANYAGPDGVSQITVEGGIVKYSSVSFGGSNKNRSITLSGLTFEGDNLSDESVVEITVYRNGTFGTYTQTIETTIGDLNGN